MTELEILGNLLYDADGDHSGVSILSTTGTITMYIDGDGIWNCVDGIGGPYVPIEATLTCTTPSAIDMSGMAVTTSPTLILANGPFVISNFKTWGLILSHLWISITR